MNMIIIGKLFQAAFIKPKNPANGIHYASRIWRSNVDKAVKKNYLGSSPCETPLTLYCGNCRKYKNFADVKSEEKLVGWRENYKNYYRVFIAILPLVLMFNYKFFLYHFKRDWYNAIDPDAEKDLEHYYPARPKGGL